MSSRLKSWAFEKFVDAVYPSILLWNNPFKIYEHHVLMRNAGLRRTDAVLDLGCGSGLHTQVLATCCSRAVGLDVSDKVIRRAEQERHRVREGMNVEFICSEIQNAGIPDEAFDQILSYSVLEHISNYEVVLRECFRVLKPGGSINFSVDWLGSITEPDLLERHRADHGVVRYFSPEEMRALLDAVGFSEIRIEPFVRSAAGVEMFRQGIRREFVYTYGESWMGYLRLRVAERDSPAGPGIYLHVRAVRP